MDFLHIFSQWERSDGHIQTALCLQRIDTGEGKAEGSGAVPPIYWIN
jgi:hypothetical protein